MGCIMCLLLIRTNNSEVMSGFDNMPTNSRLTVNKKSKTLTRNPYVDVHTWKYYRRYKEYQTVTSVDVMMRTHDNMRAGRSM